MTSVLAQINRHLQASQRGGAPLSAQQIRAEGEMEGTIPALASLLAVSAACRKSALEEAMREREDADRGDELGEAKDMEDVQEPSMGGGRGRRERRGKEALGAGCAVARGRESVVGEGSRVGGGSGSLVRSSMSVFQASNGVDTQHHTEAKRGRDRKTSLLIVVDVLDIYVRKVPAPEP